MSDRSKISNWDLLSHSLRIGPLLLTTMNQDKHGRRQLDQLYIRAFCRKKRFDWLAPHSGGRYIDGTLGGAGHTELLLERSAPDGQVLGIDADHEALSPRTSAPTRGDRFRPTCNCYKATLPRWRRDAMSMAFAPVDGILLDLGLSSDQLASRDAWLQFRRRRPTGYAFRYHTGPAGMQIW